MALFLFPQLMLHSVLFCCKQMPLAFFSPCEAANVTSLFSQISFVLPFFSWIYLAQSYSCDHFPFPPPVTLLWIFFLCFFFIHMVLCPVIIDFYCSVGQLLSYLLLSGACIGRMHNGWLVKCQHCLHTTMAGIFFLAGHSLWHQKILSHFILILPSTCLSRVGEISGLLFIFFLQTKTWAMSNVEKAIMQHIGSLNLF